MADKSGLPLLSLTFDVIFKIFFTHKNGGPLLLDLINTVLQPREPFTSLRILNPEIPPIGTAHKRIALDIVATTGAGDHVQVEMQARNHDFFRERSLYYACRLYGSQLGRGEGYGALCPTYCINFLRFDDPACQNSAQFAHVFTFREKTTGIVLSEHLQIYYIELLKFQRSLMKNRLGSAHPHLDNWLQLLLNPSDKSLERIAMSDPIIKDALKHLRDISNDPAARERARMEEDAERDWISQLEEAEWHGRAAGEAKGKAEFLASLLKNPVTAAMTDEQLAELVHLSIEQVARARASLRG